MSAWENVTEETRIAVVTDILGDYFQDFVQVIHADSMARVKLRFRNEMPPADRQKIIKSIKERLDNQIHAGFLVEQEEWPL